MIAEQDQITGNPTDLTLNDLTPSDALAFLATHYSEATALSIALSLLNVRAAFPVLKGNEALIDDFVGLVINSERMARADVKLPGVAFNTDQGSQFTAKAFTGRLKKEEIAISMDGRGRALDNVFIERLWRSLKYEDVYLKSYQTVRELTRGLEQWFAFYNRERLHQSLDYRTPAEVYHNAQSTTP